jgi:tRNA-splicing ligase RtcB
MELMKNVQGWTEGVEVDHQALNQIRNIAGLPIVAGHVAIMPDVHLGKGATVGSVIPTRGAIIPAAVGVDIGCGMCAVRTDLAANDLPASLASLRSAIESLVPVGFSMHDKEVNPTHEAAHGRVLKQRMDALFARFEKLSMLQVLGTLDARKFWKQIGTLGGGNHFIELCLDEAGAVWVMLHSGSRNIGKTIGEAAIGMAREAAVKAGAVSAREGQLGIIPGSMGAKSYIVRGKGNPLAYCSCSHGAGRRHSRGAAKRLFGRRQSGWPVKRHSSWPVGRG